MKLSFMTLGCPKWDLDTICRQGQTNGFDAVDLRGYLDELDVTRLPAFTTGAAATRRQLGDAGLAVSGISSSISVCDDAKRQANLDEARRTIDVARAFAAPHVRVFGNGDVPAIGHDAAAKIGLETMHQILALDGAGELKWVFETHDHWMRGADCARLLDGIPLPAFGALWDMGHTARVGGEQPHETYEHLRGRVYYTHVKDAVHDPAHPQAMKDGWRYVPPGQGELPLAASIRLLADHGYDGYLVFEHEKRWHPDLPEPEDALPAFAQWARQTLAAMAEA
ncbi:MAG: sugar phosphate isomerase/epimerase [Phycisphaeraceae bacterium]